MTNLLLYIQALECTSLSTLLQHAKVEGDTVYVLDDDYGDALHDFDEWYSIDVMTIIDTILHTTFNHAQYFNFSDIPEHEPYTWNDKIKQYVQVYKTPELK